MHGNGHERGNFSRFGKVIIIHEHYELAARVLGAVVTRRPGTSVVLLQIDPPFAFEFGVDLT